MTSARDSLTADQKADLIIAMVGDQVMRLARQIRKEMENPEERALRPRVGEGDSHGVANQPCEPRPLGGPGSFQQQLPGLTGD